MGTFIKSPPKTPPRFNSKIILLSAGYLKKHHLWSEKNILKFEISINLHYKQKLTASRTFYAVPGLGPMRMEQILAR
jgi:hypothetical protein